VATPHAGVAAVDVGITSAAETKDPMSYSLSTVRAATKAALLAGLAAAFDAQVIAHQPVHKHDKDAHLANVERQLALLPADPGEGKEFAGSMNGYLSWNAYDPATGQPQTEHFTSAGFGCSVMILPKEAPAA